MRMNVAIIWESGPARGRIVVTDGRLVAGTILVGWGQYKDGAFTFTDSGPAHICLSVDVAESSSVGVADTEKPFSAALRDVPRDEALQLRELGVKIIAEEDVWANL